MKKSKVEASAEEMERLKDFISWNKINWAKPISTYEAYVMKFSPDNPIKATWFLETKEEGSKRPDPLLAKCWTKMKAVARKAAVFSYYRIQAIKNKIMDTHFSSGLRIGNLVIFDLRVNSRLNNEYQAAFPGSVRGIDKDSKWRFQMFYSVPSTNSTYNSIWKNSHTPFCFTWGYRWRTRHEREDDVIRSPNF